MAFKSIAYMAMAALLLGGCAGQKPAQQQMANLLPQVSWDSLQKATAETLCRGNSELRTKVPSRKRECLNVLEEAFAVCGQQAFWRDEVHCSAKFAYSRLWKTAHFTWDEKEMMAEVFVRAGDLEASRHSGVALSFYEAALEEVPLFSRALEGVVKMKSQIEGSASSKAYLEKLLKENPDSASVMANLGVWYLNAEDSMNGRDWIRKALGADLRNSDMFRMLGNIAKAEGDAAESPEVKRGSYRYALGGYETYRIINYLDPNGWKLEADLYFDIRNLDRAVATYHTVLKLDPDFPEVRLRLAQIHRHKGDLKKAEELLIEEMERNPGLPQPYVERANMHMAQKEFAEAEKMFTKALEWQFGNLDALFGLAVIRHIEGRFDEALAILERMQGIGDDRLQIFWQKGLIYQKMGMPIEAAVEFSIYEKLVESENEKAYAREKLEQLKERSPASPD